jgi:hypothetical protein
MSLSNTDLKFYESNNRLGGSPDFSTEVSITQNGFWDLISGAESSAGDVEYRCMYARNTSTTNDLISPSVELTQNSTDVDTTIDIAVFNNVNEITVSSANESSEPAGSPTWYGADFNIALNADLTFNASGQGDFIAIWIRRTVVNANNLAANDSSEISLKGQTSA